MSIPPGPNNASTSELIKHYLEYATYEPFKESGHRLSYNEKLFLEFRTYKKMILWDLIMLSHVNEGELDL